MGVGEWFSDFCSAGRLGTDKRGSIATLVRAIQHYETFLSVSGADNAVLGVEVRARVQTLKAKLI